LSILTKIVYLVSMQI